MEKIKNLYGTIKNKFQNIWTNLKGTKWFPLVTVITVITVFYIAIYKLGELVGSKLFDWLGTCSAYEDFTES